MKGFKEFIGEEGEGGGMVSAVPANAVGNPATIDDRVAGLGNNPPVRRKKKFPVMSASPLKRTAPVKM